MARTKISTLADDDIPEISAADFARARSLHADMPEVVGAFKRGRGRPKLAHPKERVSLRLDPEIVAAYKALGEGWQTRVNDILKQALPTGKPKRGRSKAA